MVFAYIKLTLLTRCQLRETSELDEIGCRYLCNYSLLRYVTRENNNITQGCIMFQTINGFNNHFVCNSCQNIVDSFSSFLRLITELNTGVCRDDHKLPSTSSFSFENNKVKTNVSTCNNDLSTDVKIEIDETHNEINKWVRIVIFFNKWHYIHSSIIYNKWYSSFLTVVRNMDIETSTENSQYAKKGTYSINAKSNNQILAPYYKKIFQGGQWVYIKVTEDEACNSINK